MVRAYAEALVNAAEKGDEVEAVLDELDAISADVLRPHPQFATLLASPFVPAADKDRDPRRDVRRAGPADGPPLPPRPQPARPARTWSPRSPAQAGQIWDRRQNRRPVTVRSAVPLDEAQQDALRDRLARLLGGTPVLTVQVDPALIGGLVVRVGDDVYDASVRNQLEQLRHQPDRREDA